MNKKLIKEFTKYVEQIQFDINNEKSKKKKLIHSFRLQAIMKTLQVIIDFPYKITKSTQLSEIKGIGKKSLEYIDEVINYGKIKKVNDDIIDKTYLTYINQLDNIYGIGQTNAIKLYKKYGIKSIDDLKYMISTAQIELPQHVLIGLKYYGQIKEKIPRSEMENIDIYLHNVLSKLNKNLFGIICGSYRRQAEFCNDIDMLIVCKLITQNINNDINYLNKFVTILKKKKFIVDSLTSDDVPTKYMGLCRLPDKKKINDIRRIDIRFIPYESYYTALLYFTGPAEFNKKMRRVAETMNYKLNEYGLYKNKSPNKSFIINSEKKIFDLLGMEYVSPEFRY